jgi:hypothetical protein
MSLDPSARPVRTRRPGGSRRSAPGPRGRGSRALAVRVLGTALAVLVAAFAGLVGASPASAATGAYIRLAHLSPDTPAVDVYVAPFGQTSAPQVIRGVGYGAVSAYQKVPPGRYTIAMRAAGAGASTPAVISATVNATEGSAHTVAGVGRFSSLNLTVLTDDLTLPPAGQARVRVIQASSRVPTLKVAADNGPVIAGAAQFATTSDYQTVPAGTWTLRLSGANGSTTARVKLDAGGVYSVIVLDGANGGLQTVTRVDARGAQVVPNSEAGVDAGLGGTAGIPRSGWLVAGAGAATVLLASLAGLFVAARRSTGGRHGADA